MVKPCHSNQRLIVVQIEQIAPCTLLGCVQGVARNATLMTLLFLGGESMIESLLVTGVATLIWSVLPLLVRQLFPLDGDKEEVIPT